MHAWDLLIPVVLRMPGGSPWLRIRRDRSSRSVGTDNRGAEYASSLAQPRKKQSPSHRGFPFSVHRTSLLLASSRFILAQRWVPPHRQPVATFHPLLRTAGET